MARYGRPSPSPCSATATGRTNCCRLLNPINHANSHTGVHRYKVEPYVVSADVYSMPPHVGRGGWTWYTGSAGWFYRVALERSSGLPPARRPASARSLHSQVMARLSRSRSATAARATRSASRIRWASAAASWRSSSMARCCRRSRRWSRWPTTAPAIACRSFWDESGGKMTATINPLAGKPAPASLLVNVPRLVTAYFSDTARPRDPGAARRVRHLGPSRLGLRLRLQRGAYPGDRAGHLPLPAPRRHRRTAVRGHGHARAVGARLRQRPGGVRGQRRRDDDRRSRADIRRPRSSRTPS